jgi:hypothetical protein
MEELEESNSLLTDNKQLLLLKNDLFMKKGEKIRKERKEGRNKQRDRKEGEKEGQRLC